MKAKGIIIFLLILGALFIVILAVRRKTNPPTGQVGLAGGAVPITAPTSTLDTVNQVLSGVSSTLAPILGSFSYDGSSPTPAPATGVSNVPDSNTGTGPTDSSDLVYAIDNGDFVDNSTVDPSLSLEEQDMYAY